LFPWPRELREQYEPTGITGETGVVYIKQIYGNKGVSVYRVELMDNEDIHISLHSLVPRYICRKNERIQEKLDEILGPKTYIVQQGITMSQLDHQYFDIRVLVQKGIMGEWTISTIACRVVHKQYFNTSMCEHIYDAIEALPKLFSQEKVIGILQSIRDVSVKGAREAEIHMGSMGELSVDFAIDKDSNLWIIELNGKPQKSIYNIIKNFKSKKLIYSRPLEFTYNLSQS